METKKKTPFFPRTIGENLLLLVVGAVVTFSGVFRGSVGFMTIIALIADLAMFAGLIGLVLRLVKRIPKEEMGHLNGMCRIYWIFAVILGLGILGQIIIALVNPAQYIGQTP